MKPAEAPVLDRQAALSHFAALVRRLRQDAGYATAGAFHRAFGGAEHFGCTLKSYVNVEKGASLPQPALVERLAAAFRLPVQKARARDFALAYLRTLLGWEGFFELTVEALTSGGSPAQVLEAPAGSLSPAQREAAEGSADAYWCLSVLANDKEGWAPPELADLLDFSEERVKTALSRLAAAGLARRGAKGTWRCPLAGRILLEADATGRFDELEGRWEQSARSRGATVMEHPLLFRASEAELKSYFPYLVQAVRAAGRLAQSRKGPDTALFAIETRATRIVPF